jgi:hypothetical protein
VVIGVTENPNSASKPTTGGWYEVRPFFEQVDSKYADMHEISKRIHQFSYFIVRNADGMIRLFMQMQDASDSGVVQAAIKNALLEPSGPKVFSAGIVLHLKMKRHYALPIARELTPSILYSAVEKIDRPCFVAVSAKHYDESFQISQFVERNTYDKPPLWREILDMFTSSTGSGSHKKHTSPQKLMLAELAKEKQKLRHFHCPIAVGAQDFENAKSIMKALSESDGLAVASMERDSVYKVEVKKPIFFASHFCVLSDIELANIIALPTDPRVYRFNISRKETYTSGPSQDIGGA